MLLKKPVTGMKDILPNEMALRQYVLSEIRDTYRKFGFTEIETPVVEHIENLSSKQGGDNEKLIFRVEKRGEKLKEAFLTGDIDALSDSGLRYDLTLPLTRFYSQNIQSLPSPFKALQIGPVFRADRPQKGRFRQFVQCDIDIFGDSTNLGETELILAIITVLKKIGFGDRYPLHIVINDREILRAMQKFSGFPEEDFEKVSVSLDKLDKIGLSGVKEELLNLGYNEENIDKYLALTDTGVTSDDIRALGERLKGVIKEGTCENLSEIIDNVKSSMDLDIRFDPSLVRGMGYYTGPVFEIRSDGFPGSIGGGGRYDKMVGRFTGNDVAAVGFSIGFERIIQIMLEGGEKPPLKEDRICFLLEKGISPEKKREALKEATAYRGEGKEVLIAVMNKNKKFQKELLNKEGYLDIREFFK